MIFIEGVIFIEISLIMILFGIFVGYSIKEIEELTQKVTKIEE